MAGVGSLRLVDEDIVSLSNLGRQVLFSSSDIGKPKVTVAAERLRAMNPDIEVEPIPTFAQPPNLEVFLRDVDLIVDGTDSLGARQMLNRAFVSKGIPVIFGGATAWNGSVLVCIPDGPCYDCVWSGTNETSCSRAGVLGPLVGIVGATQAAEALKVLLGLAVPGRLLLIDALTSTWRTTQVSRRPNCPTCGR